ncbi:hypothetical protein L1987_38337 [Smallanthus sonchifolius]|uniref:Uncharacterized protein n=1 Tax=Smallanthus sonchifolius TaxID=185202 RepID=A0ACB9HKQ3_9ASTR|nr:hypothetical protein L1987_38337 [Smallanthus sonchifolius]
MEVFTGDHGLPTDVVLFPDTHFSPFALPTTDTFSDHHKISSDHNHFLPLQPPQKLRPIRCNVRSSSDRCSLDDAVDAKTLSWQSEDVLLNAETDGGSLIPPNCSELGLPLTEGQIEAALSPSSSEETSKMQEPINEPTNKKKRKRKSRRKMELFIESVMKSVIEKQEDMHKQLIEMLERTEKESIMRELAWKKQEIERAKRDEQARKQQLSQSQALISFIQNALGQEIQIPNFLEKQDDDHQNQENLNHDAAGNDDNHDIEMNNIEESECDPNTRRWPKSEVQALIMVRAALNHKFIGKGSKGSVWGEVAADLSGMGYNRTPKKCKEKWENINKYYRRTTEKGKESKTCKYFSELEMLHKTGFISSNSHDEDQKHQGIALEFK